MELKQLSYFVTISDNKSFSKTSRQLYITQQALSKAIQNLELELSVKLFDRNINGIVLTPHGKYLYEKVKPVTEAYDRICSEIQSHFNINCGIINFCTAFGTFRSIPPEVLMDFQRTYNDIILTRIEMPEFDCEQSVLNDLCDLACTMTPLGQKDLEYVPIKYEELFLIVHCDNPLSQKSEIDFTDLINENIICYENRFTLRQLFEEYCERSGFRPNIIYESNDVDVLIRLVYSNKGISLCVKHVSAEIKNPNIRSIPFKDNSFKWEIGFIYKKNKKLNQITKLFMEYVLNNYKNYPWPY